MPKGNRAAKAGTPIRLRPWQREIVHGLFDDPRPRQGLVSVARKNGKTLLAAALGLYGLLGDVEESAEVLIVSVDENTAKVCFNLCRTRLDGAWLPAGAWAVCAVEDARGARLAGRTATPSGASTPPLPP